MRERSPRTRAVRLSRFAGAGSAAAEPGRLAIPLASLPASHVEDAARESGSVVVRTDPVLGFVVVEAADVRRFEESLGAPSLRDVRGGGSAHAMGAAPADSLYGLQWGPQALRMPDAWALGRGSTSVKVAIVDSGLDFGHLDFMGVPVEKGWDYVDSDGEPADFHGHGTLAGIVAARSDGGFGMAGMAEATLIVIRVLDASNAGWCSDFASAVVEAADRGADVINLSLYCSVDFLPLRQAVQYAAAKGVLVVASAGNHWQTDPDRCVNYPARYPEVVAVAALRTSPVALGPGAHAHHSPATFLGASPFSCRGSEVELAAPGQNVLSAIRNQRHDLWSGTSMAAPHVAGAAALLLAKDASLTAEDVRAGLGATAVDLGVPGRDSTFGFGRVEPRSASMVDRNRFSRDARMPATSRDRASETPIGVVSAGSGFIFESREYVVELRFVDFPALLHQLCKFLF